MFDVQFVGNKNCSNIDVVRSGINHFYVVHEDVGGLFACSKGRPNKELTKMQLECPQQIEEDLAGLRNDFVLNDNSKMLLLVSMATDEMIRLVSMYPEVWFMDTTTGEETCLPINEITWVLIVYMNS